MKTRFKEQKLGVRRALLAGTIFGAMIIGGIIGALNESRLDGGEFFGYTIFAGIPTYWALVFIGLWIVEGFNSK